jgi:hypothetical protein
MAAPNPNRPEVGDILIVIRESPQLKYPALECIASALRGCCMKQSASGASTGVREEEQELTSTAPRRRLPGPKFR